tara:strand:- start:112 stop:774 length:663 start_codon:yes stop_codon:yes gene_type:complete
MRLENQNIIILTEQFSPSIITSYWLIKNKIFKEDEIGDESIFSKEVCQIATERFNVIVFPSQINVVIKEIDKGANRESLETVKALINSLPHIVYKAAGINFSYNIPDKKFEGEELSKILFFNPKDELHGKFNNENAKFGTYLSMDFDKCRLKLDIKPSILNRINKNGKPEQEVEEVISFAFNFHRDFGEMNAKEELNEHISLWDSYSSYAKEITDIYKNY